MKMKLRGINRNLLIIFSLILAFGIIFGIMNTITDPVKSRQDVDLPKSSYADEVNYGEWVGIYWSYPDSNDYIDWSFNGSNSYVGITVIAMDDTNFWNFDNGYSYTSYSLSSGAYYIHSGTFYPLYEDQWYIIFMNEDPDMQSTYLTYEGTWYAVPDTLTITSPTSSSSWERGTNKYIYWNTQGSVDYVDLRWYKGGVLKYYYYDLTNDGDSYWAIPSDCEIGTDWRIYIEDSSDSSVNDYSDYFEIYSSGSITVTSPTSSSSCQCGTSHTIRWSTTGSISSVKIELYKGAAFEKSIIVSTTNDGEYGWSIPTDLYDSSNYRIKITDTTDSSVYDYSDYFQITSPTDTPEEIPGYDIFIIIGIVGIISLIINKKRNKN